MKQNLTPDWVIIFFERLHLPEKKKIAEKLLKHEGMRRVYSEIDEQLSSCEIPHPKFNEAQIKKIGRDTALAAIIDSAVFCNPIKHRTDSMGTPSATFLSSREIRNELKVAKEIENKILKISEELISLIDEYVALQERGYVGSDSDLDIFNLINSAAQNTADHSQAYKFESYVSPVLDSIDHLDCGYYPFLQQVIEAVRREIFMNPMGFSDHFLDWSKVITSQQASNSDFVRCFLIYLHEMKRSHCLPKEFRLKDSTIAEISECVLDLDEGYTEASIRKIREKLEGENFI